MDTNLPKHENYKEATPPRHQNKRHAPPLISVFCFFPHTSFGCFNHNPLKQWPVVNVFGRLWSKKMTDVHTCSEKYGGVHTS